MKRLISATTAFAIFANSLSADMDSYLKTVVDSTPPKAYRSENVIGYSGGDFRMRFGTTGVIRPPFNIQAPKLSIGCGGIDASLGGFAYLKDEMVQMFQNISAAAPAFAFQLALKTLCSQCAATLDELKALADQINSIAQDSCKAGDFIAGKALSLLQTSGFIDNPTEKTRSWENDLANNPINNATSSLLGPVGDWAKNMRNKLQGAGATSEQADKALQPLNGSLLEASLSDSQKGQKAQLDSLFGTDSIAVMRAMLGDAFGYLDNDKDKYKLIDPVWNENEIRAFIGINVQGTMNYPKISVSANKNSNPNIYTSAPQITNGTFTFSGMSDLFKKRIQPVLTKLGMPNTTIGSTELNGIQNLPIPIYRILQNEVLAKGLGQANVDDLAQYIAGIEAVALVQMVTGAALKFAASTTNQDSYAIAQSEQANNQLKIEFTKRLIERAQYINKIVTKEAEQVEKRFLASIDAGLKQRQIERNIKAQLAKTSLFQKGTLSAI